MQEHLYRLIVKEQTEGLSEEEEKILNSWLQDNTTHREAYGRATALVDNCKLVGVYEGIDVAQAWTKVASAISTDEAKVIKSTTWRRWIPYVAAAAMLVLSIGVWKYSRKVKDHRQMESAIADVAPGGNRAYLKTESGEQISLSTSQSTLVIGDEINYADGSRVQGIPADNSTVQNLQLVIPRGGTYQVILDDGTKVWLNSDSKLRYPNRFEGTARRVQLEGEAYFEVAKDKNKLFIVDGGKQEITVTGTQFNLNTYKDEPMTTTTLVEGQVRIADLSNGHTAVLAPGQQAVSGKRGLEVQTVNTDVFIAWKDNYFVFESIPLPAVLRQLSRWYDVEVDYEGLPHETISARIRRDKNISVVLRAIAQTSGIDFQIKERRIMVKE
ncbi:FecR family protein [Sphingobacterium faecale]|uniref:DUF4974 domain-containing protein n=1 Tax=Sphingobacterium faecale TaxID=2803775 RepID=A0ABS1QXR8_9SPHI|nr:FecR family protein [Sphingobacterium faecale]MBL1407211.1 DUF4974 domain-containing protein [Sphingobacterium faecale]